MELCNDMPCNIQLYQRFLKFICSCLKSDHQCVRVCANLAVHGSSSNMCHSISQICHKLNMSRYNMHCNTSDIRQAAVLNINEVQVAGLIHDFIYLYQEIKDTNVLEIINDLCTL